jgi:hypothetical protein
MATDFPVELDNLLNPAGTDSLSGHAELHTDINDALEAIQAKVGKDGSLDTDSLDYKVSSLSTALTTLQNTTDSGDILFGLEGNNDLVINGIENKTTVDDFSKSVYRTVKYELQISRGAEYVSSSLVVLNDGSNINVAESNIISNTNNNLATVTFEENSGIIGLCVTPVTSAVTVRYYRTALKA